MKETDVILKAILQSLYRVDNLEDARKTVEVLLDKDEVALIREQTSAYKGEAEKC
ncbi:MAG: hypothetical protein LBE35_04065 [Clostridiales bacterium]|nr:hypothetical protein [Clostridiales bacterium]